MHSESGAETDDATAFKRALASLKRRGSNILVVGPQGSTTHVEACSRLLGEEASRRRLFVFTDSAYGLEGRLAPGDRDGSTVRVIDCTSATRSAAAATSSGAAPVRETAPLDDLAALGDAIDRIVEDFEHRSGGLEPAELRVCVDSLRPLLAEHGDREVFHFLHALTDRIRTARGMGHFHMPVPRDDTTARVLEPLFDAVVEVRARPNLEQRWHLRSRNITTDWLPL